MAATAKKKGKSENEKPQETLQFAAEISKVLKLMIHSLYTNKDIFLRELISNASDACDKLRYHALSDQSLLEGQGELAITVAVDATEKTVTVRDNGIGMNREELIANLGTIAKSGTLEFVTGLSGDTKKDANLIGQFGVGFYSAFMVADKVSVISRKAGEAQGWVWESAGEGEFTVLQAEGEVPHGTAVKLHLREDAAEYLDKFRLMHIIDTYSDHIGFPIWMEIPDGEGGGDRERVGEGAALWTLPKSDITDEQYAEFYHHVAHSPDEPWLTLHNKAEGVIEYTSLLYVPSIKPFDLFHPERRRRVKLYVKRVFITEENVELVPHYLRFLRGVIDSADLPLNISRETLQDNPVLRKISESITGKLLGELKKKAEKEPESYTKFWENFGAVLKEGLCESIAPKEKILEVCRFHSTHGEGYASLDEYIARMKDGQSEIYYLTGDNLGSLRASPQLEGFTSRGIEVLLLDDHVDDFWVNVVPEFKGKQFKSVTRATADLDAIATPEGKKADKPEEDTVAKDKIENLTRWLKSLYGEEIKEVRTTTKLTDSPACLAVGEGDMDMRMERFLLEHRQLPRRAAKILEINPKHTLVHRLAEEVSAHGETEDTRDAALMLLDQAKIVEGEPVADASAFAKRLAKFMSRSFG